MDDISRLGVSIDYNTVVSAETALDEFGRAARRAEKDVVKSESMINLAFSQTGVAVSQRTRRLSAATSNARQMGLAAQNASYQVADFFVQVTNGTNASMALAQQLPQLLGGFGLWGAAAGAVAAILGGVWIALGDTSTAAEDMEEAIKALDAVLKDGSSTLKNYEFSLDDLSDRFGDNADEAKKLYEALKKIQDIKLGSSGSTDLKGLLFGGGASANAIDMRSFFNLRSGGGDRKVIAKQIGAENQVRGAVGISQQVRAMEGLIEITYKTAKARDGITASEYEYIQTLTETLLKLRELEEQYSQTNKARKDQEKGYNDYYSSLQAAAANKASFDKRVLAELTAAYTQYYSSMQAAAANKASFDKRVLAELTAGYAQYYSSLQAAAANKDTYEKRVLAELTAGYTQYYSSLQAAAANKDAYEKRVLAELTAGYKQYYDSRVASATVAARQEEEALAKVAAAYARYAETRMKSRAGDNVANTTLKSLRQEADIILLINQYGAQSAQVVGARAAAEREAAIALFDSMDAADSVKRELLDAWDAAQRLGATDVSSNIWNGANAASVLASNLGAALLAANALAASSVTNGLKSQALSRARLATVADPIARAGQEALIEYRFSLDSSITSGSSLGNRDIVEQIASNEAVVVKAAEDAARVAVAAREADNAFAKSLRPAKGGGGGKKSDQDKYLEGLEKDAKRIIDQTRTATERYALELNDLNVLFNTGLIDVDTYNLALDKLKQTFLETEFPELEQGIKELSDALADAAVNSGSFGDAFSNTLKRIAQDLISSDIQNLIRATFSLPGATATGGGSFFGKILGAVFGVSSAPTFEGGGYTGNGSRSGGVDGKGGFWSILHPQEVVNDLYNKPTSGTSDVKGLAITIVMDPSTGALGAIARDEAQNVVAQSMPGVVSTAVNVVGKRMSQSKSFGSAR